MPETANIAKDARSAQDELLGPEPGRFTALRGWGWLVALATVLGLAGAALWWWHERSVQQATPRFITEAVQRGDLVLRVTANGTLQPTRTVNVGSELSGTVARVLVDINDRVKKGQLLVELDPAKLRDQLERSRAALASADARVAQAAATMAEAGSKLARQRRIEKLSDGMFPAAAELDTAQAAYDRSVADEAAAWAAVADARAALRVDGTNLGKASIRSPTDGVILTRAVDPGNAVAASLQAVTLFSIAEDLTQMKLVVNIDEADVGQVREGQGASFTVSAWPQRPWPASIRRVGFGSTTKDNVVTYLAELDVANPELLLRPGMTAVAVIAAAERKDVLLVPNAALRFTPPAAPTDANAGTGGPGFVSRLMPRAPGTGPPRRAGTNAAASRQVWVLRQGVPVAVPVSLGLSDGRRTEVVGGGLREGDAVITEQTLARR